MKYVRVLAVPGCIQLLLVHAPGMLAQAPPAQPAAAPAAQTPAPGRGRGPVPVDPRVQIRMHRFADTNEDIPYALFVSSKVTRGKKAPMIVTLHGLGGTHTTMMRPNAIDLAEAGGYILLAPMATTRAAGTGFRRDRGAAAHRRTRRRIQRPRPPRGTARQPSCRRGTLGDRARDGGPVGAPTIHPTCGS